MQKFALTAGALALTALSVPAQLSIAALDTPVVIDFTGYTGTGFATSPAAGQLDADDWATTGASDGDKDFGVDNTSGDHARGSSTGGESSGGIYAFDTGSGDIAMGFQGAGSDFTPGSFALQIQNDTGSLIQNLTVEYEIWVNNDQGRGNTFNFAHGATAGTATPEASLDFTSEEVADANGFELDATQAINLTNLSIANGATYVLVWETDDSLGGGSRDEIAIDDISVTGGAAVPVELSVFSSE